MTVKLSNIANIFPGYPFRGAIPSASEGNAYVVQVKDGTTADTVDSKGLQKAKLPGKKSPLWLQDDDILFIAKGLRRNALFVKRVPADTVCSPYFFLIRLKSSYRDRVLPEFLHWQLNQKPAQQYFKRASEGSAQQSIRRQILEEAQIALLDLPKQRKIVSFYQAAQKERATYEQLINNRQKQLDAIAADELTQEN